MSRCGMLYFINVSDHLQLLTWMSFRYIFPTSISSRFSRDHQRNFLSLTRKGVIENSMYRSQLVVSWCPISWLYSGQYKSNWIPKCLIWSTCEDNNSGGDEADCEWFIWWMACFQLLWWRAKVNLTGQINFLRAINHTMLGREGTGGITW